MGPIDYTINAMNPVEGLFQGLSAGEALQTSRLNRAATEQAMDIQRREQQAREQARAAQAAAAQAQARAAAAGQAELVRLVEMGGSATTQDYLRAWVANPAIRSDIEKIRGTISDDQSSAQAEFAQDMYVAGRSGDTGAVLNILNSRLEAARNSGVSAEIPALEYSIEQLGQDPEFVHQLNLANAAELIGLRGADHFKAINEAIGGSSDYEAASPLGKVAADVRAGLLPQSALDMALSAERGDLTPKDMMTEEARLRGEFQDLSADIQESERNFDIIKVSAGDQTGAGDIALVTSFMKMLDPGSVVRETEFATAANTGGLLARLKSTVTKIENGEFLSPSQRTEFVGLARKYMTAAQIKEGEIRASYERIVDNYNLNPDNVFGVGEALPLPFTNSATVQKLANERGVTLGEFWAVMTPEQREAYAD